MDNPELIRAARSLLGWSQYYLAERCGIRQSTIANIENEKVIPQTDTMKRIVDALEKGGILFLEDGVRKPEILTKLLTGKGWFLEVIEDACHKLAAWPDKEFLIMGGDNRISPLEVIDGFRKLRNLGVKMREMVEEGNTYLNGPEEEYRWIPKQYFKNCNTIVYADRVLTDFNSKAGLLLISEIWAEAERNKFNLIWSQLPPLAIRSTANARY